MALIKLKLVVLVIGVTFANDCFSGTESGAKIGYDVLPGTGWDNLRNEIRSRVVLLNFTTCQVTDDGKYIIPDGVFVNPVKSSQVEVFSQIIKNWQNFTSDVAASINADGSVTVDDIPINGKFSIEYQDVKRAQITDDTATLKTRARYIQYTAKMQPDPVLDPKFKSRVMTIAHHLQLGRRQSARYESQLLVRDFGTHAVTSVDAGAAIVKIDHVKRTLLQAGDTSNAMISLVARAELFPVSGDLTIDPEILKNYQTAQTQSVIKTYGGPVYRPMNFSINDWIDGIDQNLAVLDRSGDPINFLITPDSFPELPVTIVSETSLQLESAIRSYYKHNTYPGCTDRDAPNFSFHANVDDGSCKMNISAMTFGGLFQNCTSSGAYYGVCETLESKNPLTGDFSCPDGFVKVPLYSGEYTTTVSQLQCSKYLIFWEHCKTTPIQVRAQYQSYWCASIGKFENPTGFMFGGVYTPALMNSLIQQKACPPYFHAITIGEDIQVCVSDDYDEAANYAVPFNGFFSCQNGNAMYKDLDTTAVAPKMCSTGYSQHLAAEVDECDINYCIVSRSVAARNMIPVRMPPYIRKPIDRNESVEYFVTDQGQSWTRVYSINGSFHGFNGTDDSIITDSGNSLDVNELLNARKRSLGLSDDIDNAQKDNTVSSFGFAKPETPSPQMKAISKIGTEKNSRHAHLPHGEIAIVAGVSAVATLLIVCMIAILILTAKRAKRGTVPYDKMQDVEIHMKN